MKQLFILFLSLLSLTSIAGGKTDKPGSSANIAINGLKFFQATDIAVAKFSFGDDIEHDIEGTINLNGQKTTFTITIPSLLEGSYAKSQDGSMASVSLQYANMYLSSSGPFIPNVDDLGDYLIEITMSTDEMIVGNFVANLQDGTSTDTIQISGEFILVEGDGLDMEASASN